MLIIDERYRDFLKENLEDFDELVAMDVRGPLLTAISEMMMRLPCFDDDLEMTELGYEIQNMYDDILDDNLDKPRY